MLGYLINVFHLFLQVFAIVLIEMEPGNVLSEPLSQTESSNWSYPKKNVKDAALWFVKSSMLILTITMLI